MTLNEQVEHWFSSAEQDMIVADSLLQNGHYLWCLFIGHLIIEKSLKGIWTAIFQSVPPKIHDLVKLAKLLNILEDDKLFDFFYDLNKFNIESRYPEYKSEIFKIVTKEYSTNFFSKIKEIHQWLKSHPKLKEL